MENGGLRVARAFVSSLLEQRPYSLAGDEEHFVLSRKLTHFPLRPEDYECVIPDNELREAFPRYALSTLLEAGNPHRALTEEHDWWRHLPAWVPWRHDYDNDDDDFEAEVGDQLELANDASEDDDDDDDDNVQLPRRSAAASPCCRLSGQVQLTERLDASSSDSAPSNPSSWRKAVNEKLSDGVYAAKVRLSNGTSSSLTDRVPPSEVEAIVKITTVRLPCPLWTRESNGHRRLHMAWMEALAWSQLYPEHFWGCLTFRHGGCLKVLLCIRHYRRTLFDLLESVLAQCDSRGQWLPEACLPRESGSPWDRQILDALVQLHFFAIPRAREQGLVCHGDLKSDNVAYRRTSKRKIYVRLRLRGTSVLLAIPTHQRLFYLIDFGWTACQDAHHRQGPGFCSSAPYAHSVRRTDSENGTHEVEPLIHHWNPLTDFVQLCRSVQLSLLEKGGAATGLGSTWRPLVRYLHHFVGPLQLPRHSDGKPQWDDRDVWKVLFYVDASRQKSLRDVPSLIDWLIEEYACSEKEVPLHRAILEYDVGDLLGLVGTGAAAA